MKSTYLDSTAHGLLPAIVSPADGITPVSPSALTCLVIKNGVDTADAVTITAVGGGRVGVYKWSYDPAGEVEGDQFSLVFEITIDSLPYYHTEDLVVVAVERGTDGANTAAPLDAAGTRAAVGLASANLDDQFAAIPTTGEIEAALINEGDGTALLQAIADKISSDLTAGDLTALALVSAIKADVTIAQMIARIDASVSSRLADTDYTPPDNAAAAAAQVAAESADGKLTAERLELIDGSMQTGADGDTGKTLSDQIDGVGGGGGGDATAANQAAILAKLNAARVSVVSNVAAGGTITIYLGDDDTGANAVSLPVDDVGEVLKDLLQDASVASVLFGAGTGDSYNEILGTIDPDAITAADGITTIPIEILSTDKTGPASDDYEWHIKTVDDSGLEKVRIEGSLKLRPERRKIV